MHPLSLLSGLALGLALPVLGAPGGQSAPDKRQDCEFDSANSPECWKDGFDLTTNWYEEAPDTGNIREYFFDITEKIAAPDGVDRLVMSINGSVPGPTIFADWGDTIVVHLRNTLEINGTSMHFHGLRMNGTTGEDGVASVTQCPTAPGSSMTYRFRATQYGTSWYHSHYAVQAWNGFFGGIVINGPASAPYDEDLGVLTLGDWYHQTTDELYPTAAAGGGPPPAQNGIINGTNVFGDGGARFETSFEEGKRYRIRLLNQAIDTHFKFAIDGHKFKVISTDLVPIKPYETDVLNIAIAQRYDIIVTADQPVDNYWLRAVPQNDCSAKNDNKDNIKGIIRYGGSSEGDPTGEAPEFDDKCEDEAYENLVPVLALDAGSMQYDEDFEVGLAPIDGETKWTLNNSTFFSAWEYPTILQVLEGNLTKVNSQNIVRLDNANSWVYFIIQNPLAVPHPIHLHGHDFWVLDSGAGVFDPAAPIEVADRPRRDVALLPGNGYLVIGFYTDNPGLWLLHCHIGWHASLGFALQLLERADELLELFDEEEITQTCDAWKEYVEESGVEQPDSGAFAPLEE